MININWRVRLSWKLEEYSLNISWFILLLIGVVYLIVTISTMIYVDALPGQQVHRRLNKGLTVKISNGFIHYHGKR